MAKTEFLGLNLTENDPYFEDWRKSIDGNNEDGQESNMQIIDKAVKNLYQNSGQGKSTINLTFDSTQEEFENAYQQIQNGNYDISFCAAPLTDAWDNCMYFTLVSPNLYQLENGRPCIYDTFIFCAYIVKEEDTWQIVSDNVHTPGFVFGNIQDSEQDLNDYFDIAMDCGRVILKTYEGYVEFSIGGNWAEVESLIDNNDSDSVFLKGNTTVRLSNGLWLKYDYLIEEKHIEDGGYTFERYVSIYPINGGIIINENDGFGDLQFLLNYLQSESIEYRRYQIDIKMETFCPYVQLETTNGRLPAIRVENDTDFVFFNEVTGEHYKAVLEDDGYTLVYWQDESGSGSGSGTTIKPQTYPLTLSEDPDTGIDGDGNHCITIDGYDGFSWKQYTLKAGETVNLVKFFSGGSVATSSAGIFAGIYEGDRLAELYREYGCVIELIGPMVITGESFQE